MLAQRREVVSEVPGMASDRLARVSLHPSDNMARISQGLPSDKMARVSQGLPSDKMARVSQGLPSDKMARVSQGLPSEKQARVSLHPRSRSTSGRWGWRRTQGYLGDRKL